jgi:hypothetical protein
MKVVFSLIPSCKLSLLLSVFQRTTFFFQPIILAAIINKKKTPNGDFSHSNNGPKNNPAIIDRKKRAGNPKKRNRTIKSKLSDALLKAGEPLLYALSRARVTPRLRYPKEPPRHLNFIFYFFREG